MILQLTNGRFIEISLDQYLEMTDEDLQFLVSLGNVHTKDNPDPFYGKLSDREEIKEDEEEEDYLD